MSTGILKFNLPEEDSEFMLAKRGHEWAYALQSIDDQLREFVKYGHKFISAMDAVEGIRKLLYNEMQDRNLTFDL